MENIKGTVEIIDIIKPVYNFKASMLDMDYEQEKIEEDDLEYNER